MLQLLLGLALPLAIPFGASAMERGYEARSCGFDLDFDGVVGESSDCRVCDGRTTDVDQNGIEDRLYYVDASAGGDREDCGPASSPCGSISYVLTDRLAPPAARQIQAICLRGTTSESIDLTTPGITGASGHYVRAPRGNQVRPFQYPRYPLLLAAWDTDGDGDYSDETAEIDASDTTSELIVEGTDRLEIAHLRFRGGNANCLVDVSFINSAPGDHQYFHDLVVQDYARGCSEWIGIEVFGPLNYFAVEYVDFRDVGGAFWWRGTPNGSHYRWQRNTVRVFGASGGAFEGVKIWDFNEGFEILDSIWNANPTAWGASLEDWGRAIIIAQCSRDWSLVNNEILDWEVGVQLQPFAAGACAARSIDAVTIDRNRIRSTVAQNRACITGTGIRIESGEESSTFVEDVIIANNFLSNRGPVWQSAILLDANRAGESCDDLPGTVVMVNNTIDADVAESACNPGVLRIAASTSVSCRQQDYVSRNNIIGGATADDDLVYVDFAPTGFISDYNVYDGNRWVWDGRSLTTLSAWRDALGSRCPGAVDGDCNARLCTPSYADLSTGDLHISYKDKCAAEKGGNSLPLLPLDIDGDLRPQGAHRDVGADEATLPIIEVPRGSRGQSD